MKIRATTVRGARSVQTEHLSVRLEDAIRAIARGYVVNTDKVHAVLCQHQMPRDGRDAEWAVAVDDRLRGQLKEQLRANGKTFVWFVTSCVEYLSKKPLHAYFRSYL